MKEFEKIIGYSAVKKELKQIADILKNDKVYSELGITKPNGLLLYGEPGVGKTLMANCLVEASGLKCFVCRKDKPNGDFINHLKSMFKKALDNAPAIIFLDDMDKFANGDIHRKDAEEYVTVQSCIDEVKGRDVFVLATANNILNLPDSLLRAGRFDQRIEIKNPVGEDALNIIKYYLNNKKMKIDVDIKSLAKILNGCSCAELETVINQAGIYAGFEREKYITMQHILKACLQIIFKVSVAREEESNNWLDNLQNRNELSSRIIYHEVGHALISEVLMPGSVSLITAYGKEGNSGGFTSIYRDVSMENMNWMKYNILISLGGMAALEQKFGIVDSGARKDYSKAFSLVKNLVLDDCICGFNYFSNSFDISNKLKESQEYVISSQVYQYYLKAKEIIALNKDLLEKMARKLATRKILYAAEIQEIKRGCEIVPINF